MAGEIKYEIVEEIGVLSENAKGWRKELNKISWNGAAPMFTVPFISVGGRRPGFTTITASPNTILPKSCLEFFLIG